MTGTLVIGGGQAGLAMSHMLTKRCLPHLVVERARIAERWRSERWDGLHFQSPNWSIELPDFPFPFNDDPDRFPARAEILDYIAAYAEFIQAPVRCGVTVTALRPSGSGFVAETTDGPIEARNVVVATGPYQRPVIPAWPLGGSVLQVHASGYRNPSQLPDGAVLVVGAGNSGAQIAEELNRAGRQVYLSVGRHRRAPRPYRGRDLIWWWRTLGLTSLRADQRGTDRTAALTSGALGGYTIDLRAFAQRGMILLGRAEGFRDGVMQFAPDLQANLTRGDAALLTFMDQADAHVRQAGLDLPEEPSARIMLADPPCVVNPVLHLDLADAGVRTVVWATGYQYDLGWMGGLAVDADGEPVHRDGVTDVPGLYFLGLHFLSTMHSALLSGVGDDAARLADHILARGDQ